MVFLGELSLEKCIKTQSEMKTLTLISTQRSFQIAPEL